MLQRRGARPEDAPGYRAESGFTLLQGSETEVASTMVPTLCNQTNLIPQVSFSDQKPDSKEFALIQAPQLADVLESTADHPVDAQTPNVKPETLLEPLARFGFFANTSRAVEIPIW